MFFANLKVYAELLILQEVESVFDVMELEDEERKEMLKMEDSQLAVCMIFGIILFHI